jgi:hypothetical protein
MKVNSLFNKNHRFFEIKNNKKGPADKLPEEYSSPFPRKSVRIGTTIPETKQEAGRSVKIQIGSQNLNKRATPDNFSPAKNFSPQKPKTQSFSPVKSAMKFGGHELEPDPPMRNPE